MNAQLPMFVDDDAPQYPNAPGWKEPTTSREAAESLTNAASIREQVYDLISQSRTGLTADEAAAKLRLSVLTVRPRCSELVADNRIEDSGRRRLNVSGKQAKVWVRSHV